jgi:uncharacterized protein (TIGR03663 family)
VDFHGPTLYYLTLVPARLAGIRRYADLEEFTLRSVPAVAGIALVGCHYFLIPYVGLPAAAGAALLAAVSPAMVYYSRYYIHETLLVLFTFLAFLCCLAYARGRRRIWAAAAGLGLGLMYATKETAVIAVAAAAAAWLAARVAVAPRGKVQSSRTGRADWWALALAAGTAAATAGLLYSSFLTHPRGIIDSVTAYRTYLDRGSGYGTLHVHPWHYYLGLLLLFHGDGGPVWSEGAVWILALVGSVSVLRDAAPPGVQRPVAVVFTLYAVFMVSVYSLIPYKAPWNLLGFHHAVVVLAGIGGCGLAARLRGIRQRVVLGGVLVAAVLHLTWQAQAAACRYDTDPRNPWVYAHTGKDIYAIVQRLEALADAHPEKSAVPVQVISRENLWPLPWYLRRFTGVRWWNGVPDSAPSAPVIIATPDMEPALVHKLYEMPPPGRREMYVDMFDRYVELRPGVEIRGYVAKWLWDSYLQRSEAESGSPPEVRR